MFSRKILFQIFVFFICIKHLNASFCGESSLPYYLKITPKNELILGCAKPTCLNFLSGAPSHFSSLENGYFDGFKNMPKYSENTFNVSEKIECDEEFGATKCFKDGEWIGGIHPKTADSENLSFRCCRNSEMKKAKFQKVFNLQTNDNEFIGGDIYEKGKLIGFDYISNIVQFENKQGINYEIFVYRISCINDNFLNSTLIAIKHDFEMDSDKNDFEKQKLFQSLLAENPNTINNVNGLENINTQNEAELEGGAAICQNISILTRSGRGIDQSITQLPEIDANGNPTISVICTSTNPSASLVFNWFEQNAFRATSNGVGTITRNFTCYNNVNQRVLNQPNESGTNSIVDQVECISGDILLQPTQPLQAPLQQFQPVQQPAYNPVGYQAPSQYPTSWSCPSNMYCFSADTLVTIHGGQKRMNELLIGDWILSGGNKNGKLGYSKVISWIHKKSNLMAKFLKFNLENGESLKITKKHYIYKGNCTNTTNLNDLEMVFAENVSISDCLFTVNKYNELIKTRISKIENVVEKGIYSPLTTNGNIIVNEIFASCYSNINDERLQFSLPSFTKNVKNVLFSIKLHHPLSSSSSSISNEIDLIPGFNFIFQILQDFLPLKYFVR